MAWTKFARVFIDDGTGKDKSILQSVLQTYQDRKILINKGLWGPVNWVSKTFGGSSILSSPAPERVKIALFKSFSGFFVVENQRGSNE